MTKSESFMRDEEEDLESVVDKLFDAERPPSKYVTLKSMVLLPSKSLPSSSIRGL